MVMSIAQPQPFGMDCPMHDVHGEAHEDQSGTEWWSHKGLMLVLRMHGMITFRGWKARGPVASVLPHGTSVLVTDQRGKKTAAVLQEPPGNPQGIKLIQIIYLEILHCNQHPSALSPYYFLSYPLGRQHGGIPQSSHCRCGLHTLSDQLMAGKHREVTGALFLVTTWWPTRNFRKLVTCDEDSLG